MKKRFLAMLLSLCMVLSLLPVAAFAAPADDVASIGDTGYATLADAVAAANTMTDATVTLLSDVTLGEKLTISSNVTIAGAYTVTRDAAYTGTLFEVSTGATLTLDGNLVIDGNNVWTLNTEPYNKALELEAPGVTWTDLITSEEGKPNATAAMFVVNGSVEAKNVTIQNNYSTKDSNSGDGGIFKVEANADLTMTGATVQHIVTGGANSVAHLGSGAVWTINDGTLITDTFAGRNGGVCRNDSGKIVMTGGTIEKNNSLNTNGTVFMMYQGSFEMNGGKICSNTGVSGTNNGRCAAIYLHSGGKMTMTGGEICHNAGISYGGIDTNNTSSELTITGGYVGENISVLGNANHDVNMYANTSISGGSFTQDVTKFLAPGYGLTYDAQTRKYTVIDSNSVNFVEMNGVGYPTLQAAINAAGKTPSTIKVLENHKVDVNERTYNYPVLLNGHDITLDLNGKTVIFDYAAKTGDTVYTSIALYNGAKLTVIDSSEGQTGTLYNKYAIQGKDGPRIIWTTSACSTVIEGGRFISEQGDTMFYTSNSNKNVPTTLYIKGGYFEQTILNDCFNQQDNYQKQIIELTGGTFNHDPRIGHQNEWEVKIAPGHIVIENEDGTWSVVRDSQTVKVVIYRNGDMTKPYKTVDATDIDVIKGETLDLTKLDINDYYSSAQGFKFDGWYNDGGWNNYKAGNPNNKLGDSITINGWTNIICMVNDYEKVVVKAVIDGDKDNAETIHSGKALKGSDLTEYLASVDVPEKTGYTLDKWYNWDWYGQKIGADATVNGWTNVYVTYTANEYTIKYDANGGEGTMADSSRVFGKEFTLTPNAFTRDGYVFTGWSNKADGTGNLNYEDAASATLTYAGNITLFAQWAPRTDLSFQVLYKYVDDGSYIEIADPMTVENQTFGTKVPVAAYAKDIPGFTYRNASKDPIEITTEKGLRTILYYVPNTYTVTFDANGGEGTMKPQSFTYTEEQSLTANAFTKTGYHFIGWKDATGEEYSDGEEVMNLTTEANGNVTLYAQWEINTADFIYHANNGSSDSQSVTYTYGTRVTLPAADTFAKTGYTLSGWSTYSKWGKIQYTYDPGQNIGKDHVNLGWSYDNTGTKDEGKVHFYAQWTPNTYTVTFDGNGANKGSMDAQTFTYDAKKVLTSNAFTCKGHTFTGWNTAADGSGTGYADVAEVRNLTAEANGNITLYAQWTPNTYIVAFNPNGGTGSMADVARIYKNAEPLHSCTFTREGYTFTGWNTAADGSGKDYKDGSKSTFTSGTDPVTLYAQWEANTYTVTLDPNNGAVSPETVFATYDAPYSELPKAVRTGYTFVGWTLEDGTPITSETVYSIPEDSKLVAMWQINEYTVTFDAKGGKAVEPQTVNHGDTAIEPTTTRGSYRFQGWYLDGEKYDFSTPVTGDITLTAQWSKKKPSKPVEPQPPVHDCPSEKFIDVDQSLWYHEGIDYVILNNLMNGVADNLFAPNGTTNRAMIVTILYRLEGSPAAEAPTFSDVADGQWYTDAVGWAAANGIVTGYDADTFGPLNPITREQMAAILYRYADSKGYDVSVGQDTNLLSFTDAETVSEYAIPAIQWAVGSDLINGMDGKLVPQGSASRAQVATILMRFCENVVK